MYITYHEETKIIQRADSNKIIPDKGYLLTEDIEVSDEVLENLPCYKYVDGDFVKDPELEKEVQCSILRSKRDPLLNAFDIYKSNLIIGAIDTQEETKKEVLQWYNNILDLSEEAINNPPEIIKKYL